MKQANHWLSTAVAVVVLAAWWAVSPAGALPPDPNNAALLYYQAFLMMPQDQDQVALQLQDLPYGVEPNDQIREYLKRCRPAVDLAVAASQIPACDWGLRYSQGFQMQMAHLAQIRRLAFLLRDDSKTLVAGGHYRQALDRCLTMRQMAQHAGDENLISWLVGVAINALANKAVRNTLGLMPADAETLVWLKGELETVPERPLLIQNCLRIEEEVVLAMLTVGNSRLKEVIAESVNDVPPDLLERLRKADEAFFEGSRKYFKNYVDAVRAIIDDSAPYAERLSRLEALDTQPALDAKVNPHAMLTAALMPSVTKVLMNEARAKSGDNMLKAAVEVYLVKARTGSIPDQLGPGMPKDPLSGQDFEYETTHDGFVLRCRTAEAGKDKPYENAFVVK